MNINFFGDVTELQAGISHLTEFLKLDQGERITIDVKMKDGDIETGFDGENGYIYYKEKIHFFRLLGLFIQNYNGAIFKISQIPQFKTCGVMLDASRNAVPTIQTISFFLRKMALMGLNMFMLYTEDTYEIEKYPYFGYMRGRYSSEEIKKCDDIAYDFGIEMIPCIQTLSHLTQVMKWKFARDIKGTDGTILVGEEKTYQFIDDMITAAILPYRTKKIHLGLDEATDLNAGNYLNKNGFNKKSEVMQQHLKKVSEIANKKGLLPLMWSDMYFDCASGGYEGTTEITDEIKRLKPNNMQIVYWDYTGEDIEEYCRVIENHKKICENTMFAGGLQTWHAIVPNYGKIFRTANASLTACKKTGIKEVLATSWGDGGAESNAITTLLGLQLYAEHTYSKEVNSEYVFERFQFCTGENAQDFYDFAKFDQIPETKEEWFTNTAPSNPSKYLLFQDILLGLCDKNIENVNNISDYYKNLSIEFSKKKSVNPLMQLLYDYGYHIANALALKADIGLRIKKSYDEKNIPMLTIIINDLVELQKRILCLHHSHKILWLETNKSFGFEVIDMQYGALIFRINFAIERLNKFINGEIRNIEELDQERLRFEGIQCGGATLGRFGSNRAVSSACIFY